MYPFIQVSKTTHTNEDAKQNAKERKKKQLRNIAKMYSPINHFIFALDDFVTLIGKSF